MAGNIVATRVTSMPTANAQTTVLALSVSAPVGTPKPNASNAERRPAASPTPASRPRTDATNPIASASSPTDQSTCPRDAPIARSSADSRVRWAMMIENVL